MVKELLQNPQTLVAGEFFVEIAIGFFQRQRNCQISLPFFPQPEYRLGSRAFRANLIATR
jgi:hypothetical protein